MGDLTDREIVFEARAARLEEQMGAMRDAVRRYAAGEISGGKLAEMVGLPVLETKAGLMRLCEDPETWRV